MTKIISLKQTILRRLIIPLIFFVALETVLSYFVTLHYVDKTYDRWLLDSARSLAQEIKIKQADVSVELPVAALEIFKWDDLDNTYFKINSTAKGLIAGDSFVPEALSTENWLSPVFFAAEIHGQPVRVVSMGVKKAGTVDRFFVHVAETINKRKAMMIDILLADLLPQLVLVLLACLYLLSGLKRGLKPLQVLARQISKRSPRDLSPIEDAHVFAEVRTLTDTINGLLYSLAEAITAQQRFVANAAHQLRTPLAGLVLQAERAFREQDLAAIKPAIAQMQQCAERLSHTITQLLVLAKSGPIPGMHELKPLNLSEVVKSTCMDWAPKALQRPMELSLDCTEPEIMILGDSVLLRELLANLLDNAIAYGHPNGTIQVKLSRRPCPCMTVEDDGPGIPEREKNKIFERFYRLSDSPGQGCGLGLAIVKEIADLHKARIELTRDNSVGITRIAVKFEPR